MILICTTLKSTKINLHKHTKIRNLNFITKITRFRVVEPLKKGYVERTSDSLPYEGFIKISVRAEIVKAETCRVDAGELHTPS